MGLPSSMDNETLLPIFPISDKRCTRWNLNTNKIINKRFKTKLPEDEAQVNETESLNLAAMISKFYTASQSTSVHATNKSSPYSFIKR